MDSQRSPSAEKSESIGEIEVSKDLAGMSLGRLLREMTRLKKAMLVTGENTERINEHPAEGREQRLQDVYEVLHERGVKISRDGELQPEKCELSSIREQVERFMGDGDVDDEELDQAA